MGYCEMKRPIVKKRRPRLSWTKEDVQMLKTMVREKTKTTVVASKLKRTSNTAKGPPARCEAGGVATAEEVDTRLSSSVSHADRKSDDPNA
jgi:hypothetical protein